MKNLPEKIHLYLWKHDSNHTDILNPKIYLHSLPNNNYTQPNENAKNLMKVIFNAIPYNTNQIWIEKLVKDIKSHLNNPESFNLILNDEYYLENIIRISLNELTNEKG